MGDKAGGGAGGAGGRGGEAVGGAGEGRSVGPEGEGILSCSWLVEPRVKTNMNAS